MPPQGKSLHFIAIVPVEFFSKHDAANFFKETTSINQTKIECKKFKKTQKIAKDFTDSNFEFFFLNQEENLSVYLAMEGSSICFAIIRKYKEGFSCDVNGLEEALNYRRDTNKLYLKESSENLIYNYLRKATKDKKQQLEVNIKPSYVFSFFCVLGDDYSEDEIKIVKLLSSPAVMGIDDASDRSFLDPEWVSKSNVEHVHDYDTVHDSKIYISWSTISCLLQLGNEQNAQETEALLIAMETRLQIIWNRCYSFSQLAENILEDNIVLPDPDELIVNFARTIDDGQAILSSRMSERASKIFDGMIETSKIKQEIHRLEGKLQLVRYYVSARRKKEEKKYRKIVEATLFSIASLSLLEWAIGYPIFEGLEGYKLLISVGYFIIISVLSIFIFRKS